MKRTFEELDEKYNIKRFVFMWLEDYEPNMGFHVLGHMIEHVVNSELAAPEETKDLLWGDIEYGKDT